MVGLINIEELVENLNKLDEDNGKLKENTFKVFELFSLQDGFQKKAIGREDWWNVEEVDGKPINYMTAILAELGEAIDSLDFEWWASKNKEDKANFVVELIDILHFELSKTMLHTMEIMRILPNKEEVNLFPEMVILTIAKARNIQPSKIEISKKDLFNLLNMYASQSILQQFCYPKDINNEIDAKDEFINIINYFSHLVEPLEILFMIFNSIGVSFDEVCSRYKLKNALNVVRKLNGYKEGKYEKQWISIQTGLISEDNVVAKELVLSKNLSLDEMVSELDDYYKSTVLNSI